MARYSKPSIQNTNNWRFWIKTNALLNLRKEQDSHMLTAIEYVKHLNEQNGIY